MKEHILITRDTGTNMLRVAWIYYGSIMVSGSRASNLLGVRHEDREETLEAFDRLKNIAIDKMPEIKIRKRGRK
jgi:hypothetical protein